MKRGPNFAEITSFMYRSTPTTKRPYYVECIKTTKTMSEHVVLHAIAQPRSKAQ